MLESHKGRDYAKIVHWLVQRGYGVAGRILDSQYFGVPQRRRRVFLVASFGDGRAAEILFERESLPGNPATRRNSGQDVAYSLRANPSRSGDKGDGGINTLVAHALRAQGQLAHREDVDTLVTYDARGNGNGQTVNPLVGDHSNRVTDYTPLIAFSSKDDGRDDSEDISPTLRSMNHDKSHANGGGQVVIAFNHTASQSRPMNPSEEVSPSLESHHTMAVAFQQNYIMAHGQANAEIVSDGSPSLTRNHEAPILIQEVATTLDAGYFRKRGSNQQFFSKNGDGEPVTQSGVRRLTPVECERLQGFDDDWTAWGISETGEVVEQADTTRYRQLGNAVTRTVARWLGKRIVESS